jgi:hypothetical protein
MNVTYEKERRITCGEGNTVTRGTARTVVNEAALKAMRFWNLERIRNGSLRV